MTSRRRQGRDRDSFVVSSNSPSKDDRRCLRENAAESGKGALELPYLADIGVEPRYESPGNIGHFLTFLHDTMYPGFKFVDVQIYIDTPDQAFGEYTIHQKSGISGKLVHQRFFGHCVVADGKIVLLREALNVLAAADGMFPNGVADVLNKK